MSTGAKESPGAPRRDRPYSSRLLLCPDPQSCGRIKPPGRTIMFEIATKLSTKIVDVTCMTDPAYHEFNQIRPSLVAGTH